MLTTLALGGLVTSILQIRTNQHWLVAGRLVTDFGLCCLLEGTSTNSFCTCLHGLCRPARAYICNPSDRVISAIINEFLNAIHPAFVTIVRWACWLVSAMGRS
ncbi:hypothetical protein M404DRAFT_429197 [Pisolithus tinctorius Marx 270]|uniref:Uncharacterized protein n=1 Tax=Pisolithus tinctorius Marx 270 TaxID=870435 RepID=A0A0C3KBW3_PISTI|nr:hypothetical protein M404DRAFT_429197 [Pisolithus tinctorius Marx 270]